MGASKIFSYAASFADSQIFENNNNFETNFLKQRKSLAATKTSQQELGSWAKF